MDKTFHYTHKNENGVETITLELTLYDIMVYAKEIPVMKAIKGGCGVVVEYYTVQYNGNPAVEFKGAFWTIPEEEMKEFNDYVSEQWGHLL